MHEVMRGITTKKTKTIMRHFKRRTLVTIGVPFFSMPYQQQKKKTFFVRSSLMQVFTIWF
jgi:hypothetical protein